MCGVGQEYVVAQRGASLERGYCHPRTFAYGSLVMSRPRRRAQQYADLFDQIVGVLQQSTVRRVRQYGYDSSLTPMDAE